MPCIRSCIVEKKTKTKLLITFEGKKLKKNHEVSSKKCFYVKLFVSTMFCLMALGLFLNLEHAIHHFSENFSGIHIFDVLLNMKYWFKNIYNYIFPAIISTYKLICMNNIFNFEWNFGPFHSITALIHLLELSFPKIVYKSVYQNQSKYLMKYWTSAAPFIF